MGGRPTRMPRARWNREAPGTDLDAAIRLCPGNEPARERRTPGGFGGGAGRVLGASGRKGRPMTVQEQSTPPGAAGLGEFTAAWRAWHARHEARLADPHGFLAITSLRSEERRVGKECA